MKLTPDGAIRFWHRARVRASSIPAFDPVAIRGLHFARTCSKCGARAYREHLRRDGSRFARCRRCGRERDASEVHILRGRVQMPQSVGLDLTGLADVELALNQVPENDLRIYGLYVLGDRSRDETLRQIRELGWGNPTDWGLRAVVKRSRVTLAWHLHRRGLLSGVVEQWQNRATYIGRNIGPIPQGGC